MYKAVINSMRSYDTLSKNRTYTHACQKILMAVFALWILQQQKYDISDGARVKYVFLENLNDSVETFRATSFLMSLIVQELPILQKTVLNRNIIYERSQNRKNNASSTLTFKFLIKRVAPRSKTSSVLFFLIGY